VQHTIQNEIDTVVGRNRLPTLNDRPKWVCDNAYSSLLLVFFKCDLKQKCTMRRSWPLICILPVQKQIIEFMKVLMWYFLKTVSSTFQFGPYWYTHFQFFINIK
jgi:hypothetical protein